MSRFAALDLNTLPRPSAIGVLDFDSILEARLVELEARLRVVFEPAQVSEIMALARNIAASPTRYLAEAGAARELYGENRINEAVRSVFLATAHGGDLDQIGANRNVVRRVLDNSDPDNPVPESDDAFRARIQLVMEAWSPHGTEGSYVYWALDADDRVVDVVVYGPNHDLDPPIPPAQPKMVILSRDGDGRADDDLLAKVRVHCMADRRRPVGDLLTVVSAQPVLCTIEAVLHVTRPESGAAVLEAARAAAETFLANRLRIGRKLYRASLCAALAVPGVEDVDLRSPAEDIDIGPFQALHCSDDMDLSITSVTGGWRDV